MRHDDRLLAEKLKKAEGALARDYGSFALFGIFDREGSSGKWDVVVSAPWLKINSQGIRQIVDYLTSYITQQDWLAISRVVPLRPEDEFVKTITHIFNEEHSLRETGSVFSDGIQINRAFIITANKHPVRMNEYKTAAG